MDTSTTHHVFTITYGYINNGTNTTKNGTYSQDQEKNLNQSDNEFSITLNWYIITFAAILLISFVMCTLIRTRHHRMQQQRKENEYLAYFHSVLPHSKIYGRSSFDANANTKIVNKPFFERKGLHSGLRMIADLSKRFNFCISNKDCNDADDADDADDHSNAIELESIKLVDNMENVQIISSNLTDNECVVQISNDIPGTKDIGTNNKSTKYQSENIYANTTDTELTEMDKQYVNSVQEAYALEIRRYLQNKTTASSSEESYTTPPGDESVRENPVYTLSNLVDDNTTYTRCGNKHTLVHADHGNHRNQVKITLTNDDTDDKYKIANTWL